MEHKTLVAIIALALLPLFLMGCDKTTESTQEAVSETTEMANGITEDVKEKAAQVVESASETISDVTKEVTEQASEAMESTAKLATDTAENAKETVVGLLDTAKTTVADAILPTSKDEALALAKTSGCLACHKIDSKLVGPAWQDVATRYKDDPAAKDRLIEKVSKGGKGNWTEVTGGTPMPPYSPRVSDEDIEKLVTFVLSL